MKQLGVNSRSTAPTTLSDKDVEALYANYAKKAREKKEAAAKETQVKRVKTDERGRWEHIPYPNSTQDEVQPERGGEET